MDEITQAGSGGSATTGSIEELIRPGPRPLSHAEIERRFTYHRPEGAKISAHEDVRADFKLFANRLADILPPGRETSLAFTKLEEAANWAHAAIARPPSTEGGSR